MKNIILLLHLIIAFSFRYAFSQTNLNLTSLPLQITVNQGSSSTFHFNAAVSSIRSRNPGLISWAISGNDVTFTGIKSGRTGLQITSGSQNYYLGMRINNSNGNKPGLPSYLSIGSVSEDTNEDLAFWKDIHPGLKNKAMDIRYIYINGGPFTGWASWGNQRPGKFARESLRHGLIPFFVYYNIPDGGESYTTDLAHIQDPNYMTAYFKDLNMFLDSVENVMKGELYGIILEPDFLGYMQQNASPNDPLLISTAVSATTIATNAGNICSLVQRINKTIQDRRIAGSNLFFGWQQNLWSCPRFQGTQGVMRRSDDNTFAAAKFMVEYTAREATMYQMRSGVLSNNADFISIDKYGLDAMGFQNTPDPAQSTWFWNNDHWNNYLLYAKTIHQTSAKPVILWQLPVGHTNGSNYMSAYSNTVFADLPNTHTKFEDSSTDFFLGDSLTINNATRLNYFKSNLWNDSKLILNNNQLYWNKHLTESRDAGIISLQFGAGVAQSTDGIGNPPTDDYFWIQKVQHYYANTVPLNTTYGESPLNPCSNACPPDIQFISPLNHHSICRSTLDTAFLYVNVSDKDGSIASINANIDGMTVATNPATPLQIIKWVPPTSWGSHTLSIKATDNSGLSNTQSINFSLSYSDPTDCGYPEWNASTVYNVANTHVTYNGLIFKNKYYTQNNMPYLGEASSPWALAGVCPCALNPTGIKPVSDAVANWFIYPNPVYNLLQLMLQTNDIKQVRIYDLSGRLIIQNNVNSGINSIECSMLQQGLYIVELREINNSYYTKLIKE